MNILDDLGGAVDDLGKAATDTVSDLGDVAQSGLSAVGDVAESGLGALGNAAESTLGAIGNTAIGAVKDVGSFLSGLGSDVSGFFSSLFGAIGEPEQIAEQLRAMAKQVDELGQKLQQDATQASWQGEAANAFRSHTAQLSSQFSQISSDLNHAADLAAMMI